jgi:hypothetical protein
MSQARYVNLFEEKLFSPKQAELFDLYRDQRQRKFDNLFFWHILALVWGRRCGKSDGGSALFAEMLVDVLCDTADAIARGERRPWAGLGRSRVRQRRSRPHELCFVIAPSGRDLIDISGHLLDTFTGDAEVFLHDDPKMAITDNGGRMWLVHEGAAVSISFIPARNASSMVGRGPAICYITEAGFVPSTHWDRLLPSFWDRSTWVIAEGTPTQDASHWFTQLAVSGLKDGHPEADRKIAPRNPKVYTSRANTIEHAFLESARIAAKEEIEYKGERWGKLWVYASWEQPADVVFDQYKPEVSVIQFTPIPPRIIHHGEHRVERYPLPKPDRVEIYVDWHRGAAPGACICLYIYNEHPLDRNDPRPMFVVVDEHMDDKERLHYVKDGWWRVIGAMRDRWGAFEIYADPTGVDLIKQARRYALQIKKADNEDKGGRLQLVNAQCHVSPAGYSGLYLCMDNAKKTAHCVQTLQWRKDKDGRITDKPSGYNDHLADCLAYAAGRHARGMMDIPGRLH